MFSIVLTLLVGRVRQEGNIVMADNNYVRLYFPNGQCKQTVKITEKQSD